MADAKAVWDNSGMARISKVTATVAVRSKSSRIFGAVEGGGWLLWEGAAQVADHFILKQITDRLEKTGAAVKFLNWTVDYPGWFLLLLVMAWATLVLLKTLLSKDEETAHSTLPGGAPPKTTLSAQTDGSRSRATALGTIENSSVHVGDNFYPQAVGQPGSTKETTDSADQETLRSLQVVLPSNSIAELRMQQFRPSLHWRFDGVLVAFYQWGLIPENRFLNHTLEQIHTRLRELAYNLYDSVQRYSKLIPVRDQTAMSGGDFRVFEPAGSKDTVEVSNDVQEKAKLVCSTYEELVNAARRTFAGIAVSQPPAPIPSGTGGKGGDAKVVGSGTAIGGPGGNAGKYGRGGDGGGGELHGHGLVAGGAGGSVDSDDRWSPPAHSGYEVAMEALGRPVDPQMRQYGRGGMSPGYASRYDITEEIRKEYFETNNQTPETALDNVGAVPLDYVNQQLASRGFNWRARIVRGLDYEYYVPHQEG